MEALNLEKDRILMKMFFFKQKKCGSTLKRIPFHFKNGPGNITMFWKKKNTLMQTKMLSLNAPCKWLFNLSVTINQQNILDFS